MFSNIWSLPTHLIKVFSVSWLDIKTLVRFDTSVCSKCLRYNTWLNILQNSKIQNCKFDPQCPAMMKWIIIRKAYLVVHRMYIKQVIGFRSGLPDEGYSRLVQVKSIFVADTSVKEMEEFLKMIFPYLRDAWMLYITSSQHKDNCSGTELSEEFYTCLLSNHCPRLKNCTLKIINKFNYSSTLLVPFLTNATYLEDITLWNCMLTVEEASCLSIGLKHCYVANFNRHNEHAVVTESILVAVAQRCALLTSLTISEDKGISVQPQVTNAVITAIGDRLHLLNHLNISCVHSNWTTLSPIYLQCIALADLTLRPCTNLSDTDFERLLAMPYLQKLNLASSATVSGDHLTVASATLLSLDLSLFVSLTDEGVKNIVQGCTVLKNLVLSECSRITDSAFISFIQQKPDFTMLFNSLCPNACSERVRSKLAELGIALTSEQYFH